MPRKNRIIRPTTQEEKERSAAITKDTADQYPIGCRVRERDGRKRAGTVEGYGWGGLACEGVMAKSCVKVRWDGNKTVVDTHRSNVEASTPSETPKEST